MDLTLPYMSIEKATDEQSAFSRMDTILSRQPFQPNMTERTVTQEALRRCFELKEDLEKLRRTLRSKKMCNPSEVREDWENSLLRSMEDPSQIVSETEEIVIIRDKFPKASQHYMILPREDIRDIYSLTQEHIELLCTMQDAGLELTRSKNCDFMMGFHAQPHLNRLHLHVIATDLDSSCLKKKHHWNIFTTPYFISLQTVIMELEELGKVKRRTNQQVSAWRNGSLKCRLCSYCSDYLLAMKRHNKWHLEEEKVQEPEVGRNVPTFPVFPPDLTRPPPGFAFSTNPAPIRNIRFSGN